MKQDNIQTKFLSQIREKIPKNYSFAEVLSGDLHISTDSAYRRIRGETNLSIDELKKLCIKYKISLDSFLAVSDDTVLFRYRAISADKFNFDNYLQTVIDNLRTVYSFDVKELIYAAKDIPLFYFFMFRKLAAFKIFFWLKNILRYEGLKEQPFSQDLIADQTLDLAEQVWKHYIRIPSSEIWSEESINVTLKQIEFYFESGHFRSAEEALELCYDVNNLIDHIQQQAYYGKKFDLYKKPDESENENLYNLFLNEVTISDNTVIFRMGDIKVVHMAHNVINILTTSDNDFCEYTYHTIKNIINNSILVSGSSEKERTKFCMKMKQKVDQTIKKIKNS